MDHRSLVSAGSGSVRSVTLRFPPRPDLVGLFSAAEARLAGWTDDASSHAVAAGRWIRVRPGLFMWAGADEAVEPTSARPRREVLRQSVAASRQCTRAVISHAGAAVRYGLPVVGTSGACVTVPAGTALRSLAGVHLHRAGFQDDQVVAADGHVWTSPARTVLDLAREKGLDSGVVAADAALREGLVTVKDLLEVQEYCSRWPGRRAAGLAVHYADGRAESPLESMSRVRLLKRSLPAPVPQQEILDADGRFVARVDFYWDEFGVFGEADGKLKYALDQEALIKERRRHQQLEDLGLAGARWEWRDLWRFEVVEQRLLRAKARGYPPGSPQRRWRLR